MANELSFREPKAEPARVIGWGCRTGSECVRGFPEVKGLPEKHTSWIKAWLNQFLPHTSLIATPPTLSGGVLVTD